MTANIKGGSCSSILDVEMFLSARLYAVPELSGTWTAPRVYDMLLTLCIRDVHTENTSTYI